jgi:alpha-tubulin suppressor-like RCC1 family protein
LEGFVNEPNLLVSSVSEKMPRKLSFSNNPTVTAPASDGSTNSSSASTKLLKVAFHYCRHRVTGESLFHHSDVNLSLAKALSDHCPADLLQDFLLQRNFESGYTPLHSAICSRNFAMVLLLLRRAMHVANDNDSGEKQRIVWRPMAVLAGSLGSRNSQDMLHCMTRAKDSEGFTPMQLLVKMQASGLEKCRQSLKNNVHASVAPTNRPSRSRLSFDHAEHQQDGEEEVLGVAFSQLRRDLLLDSESQRKNQAAGEHSLEHFACEVITFGRSRHHALGVVQQGVSSSSSSSKNSSVSTQRVQEFAYERVGREGSAVAVAAATHHTLVVTQQGHLLAFGLSGKNGRLGLGDSIRECPLPRRVLGPLTKRRVMTVAAAENHSLCVTRDEGWVFAWGSNRFGQLGIGNTSAAHASTSNNSRWVPRRVEENMKHVACIAVAAGEKHSVALSRHGEVYVWGDNTGGQLGIAMSRTGSVSKPQKVPAMTSKVIVRIAAAEQSTLGLARPVPGMPMNTIHQWGHGNHVPYKVSFERKSSEETSISSSGRVINPVEIACAKYHNAAITSDGDVYTWGLHAEPLGRSGNASDRNSKEFARPRSSSFNRSMSSPQLVKGMLPENGGGKAVAVAASEEHTAVLTESGTLYTWGAAHGKHVLGHEGVRWQPSPKQVPGVHRAVQVALAKEHTVLLVGASFASIPQQIESGLQPASLELLAARKVAQYVDIFNVIPILIMAERTEVICWGLCALKSYAKTTFSYFP